jgi:hypothetical protein
MAHNRIREALDAYHEAERLMAENQPGSYEFQMAEECRERLVQVLTHLLHDPISTS